MYSVLIAGVTAPLSTFKSCGISTHTNLSYELSVPWFMQADANAVLRYGFPPFHSLSVITFNGHVWGSFTISSGSGSMARCCCLYAAEYNEGKRENHVFAGDLILSNCICLCLLPPPLPDQKNPTGINKSQNTDMKKDGCAWCRLHGWWLRVWVC